MGYFWQKQKACGVILKVAADGFGSDNEQWRGRFKQGKYTLQALVPQGPTARVVDTVTQVETELLEMRSQLHGFEGEFRQVSLPSSHGPSVRSP